jgi:hypothetical protein
MLTRPKLPRLSNIPGGWAPCVLLPSVIPCRDYPKIAFDVEPAYEHTLDRNQVINLMQDTGTATRRACLSIYTLNCSSISPRWGRTLNRGFAFSCINRGGARRRLWCGFALPDLRQHRFEFGRYRAWFSTDHPNFTRNSGRGRQVSMTYNHENFVIVQNLEICPKFSRLSERSES